MISLVALTLRFMREAQWERTVRSIVGWHAVRARGWSNSQLDSRAITVQDHGRHSSLTLCFICDAQWEQMNPT